MKQCAILDKCGANPCSYVFEPNSPELSYQLPVTKPIVSRLPDAFTKFRPYDSTQFLNAELVQFTPAVIKDIETEMTVQLERQMFYEYSNYSFECIFNATKIQTSEEQKIDESLKGIIRGFPQYLRIRSVPLLRFQIRQADRLLFLPGLQHQEGSALSIQHLQSHEKRHYVQLRLENPLLLRKIGAVYVLRQ